MANYRQIHVSIWKDSWFSDLEPDEKLLFVYLFSNESTSLSGIYRLTKRIIAFETGIERKRVDEILAKFADDKKVYYEGDIVWIVNMRKFHMSKSYKVQIRINDDIASIPDSEIKKRYIAYFNGNIKYPYPIDTISQEEEDEKEKEKEDEKEKEKEDEVEKEKEDEVDENNLFSEYEQVFLEETKLPLFSGGPQKWHSSFKKIAQAATPDDMRMAIQALIDKKYNIIGPSSVINASVMAAAERQRNNGRKRRLAEIFSEVHE